MKRFALVGGKIVSKRSGDLVKYHDARSAILAENDACLVCAAQIWVMTDHPEKRLIREAIDKVMYLIESREPLSNR